MILWLRLCVCFQAKKAKLTAAKETSDNILVARLANKKEQEKKVRHEKDLQPYIVETLMYSYKLVFMEI